MSGDVEGVLARVESRLDRLETVAELLQEVARKMSNAQDQINADVSALTQCLADMAGEWTQISQRLQMEAPQIDTSKLDALAAQAQAMDQAWKAQLAPPSSSSDAASSSAPAEASAGSSTAPAETASGTPAGSEPAAAGSEPAQPDTGATGTAGS